MQIRGKVTLTTADYHSPKRCASPGSHMDRQVEPVRVAPS